MSTPISLLVCLCRIALVIWVQNHCHRTIKLLRIPVLSRVYGFRRKLPLTKALNLLLLWRPSSSCPCEFSAPGLPGHKKDVYQFQSIYSVNFTPKLLKTLLLSHFCSFALPLLLILRTQKSFKNLFRLLDCCWREAYNKRKFIGFAKG